MCSIAREGERMVATECFVDPEVTGLFWAFLRRERTVLLITTFIVVLTKPRNVREVVTVAS